MVRYHGFWVARSVADDFKLMRFCCIALVAMLIAGCSTISTGDYEHRSGQQPGSRQLVIWALSDIQAVTPVHRYQFQRAVADVATNLPAVDLGIIAGDLVRSHADDEYFRWFLGTRNQAGIDHWYEIRGNHDVRSLERFHQYFPAAENRAVAVGNLLLLLLNDESTDSQTDIGEGVFRWWRDQVSNNQGKIIITVSHAQLAGSGLLGSFAASRVISGSQRFEEVLRQYRVPLWLSGHMHLPQELDGTMQVQKELNNTCFVNVSAIVEGAFQDSQSRMLYFEDGSDIVWIRSRNHHEQRYSAKLDFPVSLGRNFSWDGSPPEVVAQFSSMGE